MFYTVKLVGNQVPATDLRQRCTLLAHNRTSLRVARIVARHFAAAASRTLVAHLSSLAPASFLASCWLVSHTTTHTLTFARRSALEPPTLRTPSVRNRSLALPSFDAQPSLVCSSPHAQQHTALAQPSPRTPSHHHAREPRRSQHLVVHLDDDPRRSTARETRKTRKNQRGRRGEQRERREKLREKNRMTAERRKGNLGFSELSPLIFPFYTLLKVVTLDRVNSA